MVPWVTAVYPDIALKLLQVGSPVRGRGRSWLYLIASSGGPVEVVRFLWVTSHGYGVGAALWQPDEKGPNVLHFQDITDLLQHPEPRVLGQLVAAH